MTKKMEVTIKVNNQDAMSLLIFIIFFEFFLYGFAVCLDLL